MEELRALAESRARDIEELRHDRVSLKMDIDALKAKVRLSSRKARLERGS